MRSLEFSCILKYQVQFSKLSTLLNQHPDELQQPKFLPSTKVQQQHRAKILGYTWENDLMAKFLTFDNSNNKYQVHSSPTNKSKILIKPHGL
jgi:hypothetical protein